MGKAEVNKMRMIVQGNELVESSYNVTLDQMRLLNLAISKINPKEPKPNESYKVFVDEFSQVFGIEKNHAYEVLKNTAKTLMRNPVQLLEISKGKRVWVEYPWFNRLKYVENQGSYVEIEFSKYVEPHLYNIRSHYTETDLIHVAKMSSPFAVRLLSWLSKARNLDKCKVNNGVLVSLTIEDLKQQTLLQDKYKDVRDLKKWLIDPAIKQINAYTDITVSYESIREGRKIAAFNFFFIEQRKLNKPIVPIRPRLPRRPHVTKGSDAEGVWARKGIELLLRYRDQLKDIGQKLTLADMRRLIEYYSIIGDTLRAESVKSAIVNRKHKATIDEVI